MSFINSLFLVVFVSLMMTMLSGCSGKGYPPYDECQEAKIKIAQMADKQYQECK